MLWLLALSIPASLLALACCQRSGAADDASEQVFGDVAALPKGVLRQRPATFRDVTITSFHPRENSR